MLSARLLVTVTVVAVLATTGTAAQTGGVVIDRTALTRADGLPSDYVLAVFEDRWGFVWFGTDAGIARWDGMRAVTFSVDDGLPHPYVNGFAETADGTLYAGTQAGLARWTGPGWERVPTPFEDPLIGYIGTDAEGRLLASAGAQVGRLEGDRWRVWTPGPDVPIRLARTAVIDLGRDRLLVSGFWSDTLAGAILSPVDDRFEAASVAFDDGVDTSGWIGAAIGRCDQYLTLASRVEGRSAWGPAEIVGEGSSLVLRLQEALLPTHSDPLDEILCSEEATWGIGRGGLRWLDGPDGIARVVQTLATSAAATRDGGVWTGTFGDGAIRIRPTPFVRLTDEAALRLAQTPDGAVWATGRRLWRVDPDGGSAEIAYPNPTRALSVTDGGAIRVGGRVALLAPLADWPQLVNPSAARSSIRDSGWISGLAETRDTLWMGSYQFGVRRFLVSEGGAVEIDTLGTDAGLPTRTVEDLRRVAGETWVLTRLGAARLVGARAEVVGVGQGLPSSSVFSLLGASDGAVWFGTDRGVAHLGRGERRATAISHPLFDGRRVVALFEVPEHPGAVWAVTARHLLRVAEGRATAFAPLAIAPDQTIEDALYHAPSGRLVLATSDGVLSAPFEALASAARRTPRVAVAEATVNEQSVALGGTPGAAHLERLPPGPHRVVVRAAAFGPRGASVEYRYDDATWRPAAADGSVVLPDLGAGLHHVEMRAVAPGGARSAETATLAFEVRPRLWERPAIRVLGLLAALTALIGIVRWTSTQRYRRRLREYELERRLHEERQRISQDLHDHVGADLSTIVSGIDLVRLSAGGDGGPAMSNLDRLDAHARRTMTRLRETIWAIHRETVTAEAFFDRVCTHARERAALHPEAPTVACALDTTDAGRLRTLTPAQTLHLYRIAQEAIGNALQHSGATRLGVVVRVTPTALVLEIADDGRFEASAPGALSGYGMSGMRRRAAEVGARLRLETEAGTTVRVALPLALPELTRPGD